MCFLIFCRACQHLLQALVCNLQLTTVSRAAIAQHSRENSWRDWNENSTTRTTCHALADQNWRVNWICQNQLSRYNIQNVFTYDSGNNCLHGRCMIMKLFSSPVFWHVIFKSILYATSFSYTESSILHVLNSFRMNISGEFHCCKAPQNVLVAIN